MEFRRNQGYFFDSFSSSSKSIISVGGFENMKKSTCSSGSSESESIVKVNTSSMITISTTVHVKAVLKMQDPMTQEKCSCGIF